MDWEQVRDARDQLGQPEESTFDALATECDPDETIWAAATPRIYRVGLESRGGLLCMLVTSKRVILGKGKLFGGARIVWSSPLSEFRKYGTGPYGSLFELQCTLNRGIVSFMFDTFDSAEDVGYQINFAVVTSGAHD